MHAECVRRKKRMVIRLLFVLIPLLVGTVFYLFFDPHTAFSARLVSLFPALSKLQIPAAWTDNPILRFCRNYLCDFCWAFSLESSVILLFACTRRGLRRSVSITLPLSVLLEILQKTESVSGTFDPADILVEAAAIFMAGFIQYFLGGKGNEKMGSCDVSGDGSGTVHGIRARKWFG